MVTITVIVIVCFCVNIHVQLHIIIDIQYLLTEYNVNNIIMIAIYLILGDISTYVNDLASVYWCMFLNTFLDIFEHILYLIL